MMKTLEIAEFLGGELVGSGEIEITRVAALDVATANELAFVEKSAAFTASNAACVLVPRDFDNTNAGNCIRVDDPKLAFALIAKKLRPPQPRYSGKASLVVGKGSEIKTESIGAFVSIGDNSSIGNDCDIGDGVRIGNNVAIAASTVIHSNCVIYDDVTIGQNCVIHAGSVIGADGFGYVRDDKGEYHQFPQIGSVVIEDNVEIGANTCIDRGALGETRIGAGTKIDNLVQIAHNVQIGKRVVIAAQTGISGSTVIEDDCVIGGQVGIGDHVRIMSGAIIGSQAGVLPGKIVRPGVWWGTPVQPLYEYKRQNAHLKGIGRLKEDVRELKKKKD